MKISPIRKKRVYQIIIEQIKESIGKGELKPGEKMPSERDFAEKLGVSRTAVREAFSVLESIGIVDTLPGIGVFLKKNSNEELIEEINKALEEKSDNVNILELIEVRQGIEVQAAYLAAIRRTGTDLQAIKKAYEKLESAANRQLVGAKEDLEFHISIVKASHNDMLLQIVKICYDKFLQGIEKFRTEEMKIPPALKISLDIEHLNIYQAIVDKDTKKAQDTVWQHLENIKVSYLTQIKPQMELNHQGINVEKKG